MRDPKGSNPKSPVVDADLFKKLSEDEKGFTALSVWLKSSAGIFLPLSQKNLTLMAARLSKVIVRFGLKDYQDVHKLLLKGDEALKKDFIEAMTTNKTEFFRESQHFDVLPKVLQDIMRTKQEAGAPHELRVWCAAASRGHEPYSILFTLLESGLNPVQWRLKFLASDIDQTVLGAGSKGVYKEDEILEVPLAMKEKYFKNMGGQPCRYLVKDEYREMITFAQVNLIQFPYPFQHKFDIIFCRNVLIYFDREMTQQVKENLAEALAPNGYLFIGHSETGSGRIAALKTVEAALFKKQKEAS